MRLIPWNDEVVRRTLNYIAESCRLATLSWHRKMGFVGEALVEDYEQVPHCYDKPMGSDGGVDFFLQGYSVDVKCDCCDYDYFDCDRSAFTIKENDNEKADYYLFVKMDYKRKLIALVGYLDQGSVNLKGRRYRKGEPMKEFYGKVSDTDCIIILQSDLEVIK